MTIENWFENNFLELYDYTKVNLNKVSDIEIYPNGKFKVFFGYPQYGVLSGSHHYGYKGLIDWFWDELKSRNLTHNWVQIDSEDKSILMNLQKICYIQQEKTYEGVIFYFVTPDDRFKNGLLNGTNKISFNSESEAYNWINTHITKYGDKLHYLIDFNSEIVGLNYEQVTDEDANYIYFGINEEYHIKK